MPRCSKPKSENGLQIFPLNKGAARSARGLSRRLSRAGQDNPLKASPSLPL